MGFKLNVRCQEILQLGCHAKPPTIFLTLLNYDRDGKIKAGLGH